MFFINAYFWPFYPVLLDLGRGKLKSKGNHSDILSLFLCTIYPNSSERVMQYLLNCVYVGKFVCGGRGEFVGWRIERFLQIIVASASAVFIVQVDNKLKVLLLFT